MEGKMPEGLGLPLEPRDYPEERKRIVGEALERWDDRALEEAVWAYLVRHRKKPDRLVPEEVGRFVRWLALQGRRWPHLEAGDLRAFLLEAKDRGFPGGPRGPLAWLTVERARRALRHLWPFLDWAGHPLPPHVEYPPRLGPLVHEPSPLSEEEWQALWRRVEEYTPAHWRPLLKVLLVLLGEVGLTLKEAVGLWRNDLQGKTLLVRGERLREVPLTPLAQEVLEGWLPLRDYLASHQPLPYPNLLLNPSARKAKGRPLDLEGAKWLMKEFTLFAGYGPREGRRTDLAHRLRWRAIRNYLKAGYPREKVAYWTGMRSLMLRGWEG
jgi:integrase